MIRDEKIIKRELSRSVADKTGYGIAEIEDIMTALYESMQEAIVDGHDVYLPGIGVLKLKRSAARPHYNIATGKNEMCPAHNVVRFKVSNVLRELVREVDDEDE